MVLQNSGRYKADTDPDNSAYGDLSLIALYAHVDLLKYNGLWLKMVVSRLFKKGRVHFGQFGGVVIIHQVRCVYLFADYKTTNVYDIKNNWYSWLMFSFYLKIYD